MKKYLLLFCMLFHFASFAQNGTEIILFDVNISVKGITLTNPLNITNHKGYDNQPFFNKKHIYYSSEADSGQMDIKMYHQLSKSTSRVTHTTENEFSPTVTPDGKFISCILQRKNGKQDLVKYPISGGKPIILINNLKVGYHAWIDNNTLLLFVLEDTTTFTLHYYNVKTKEDKTLATDIGRGLNKIPGKNAVSFIQKSAEGWKINQYNAATKEIHTIMPALPNRDQLTWTKNGLIIMSDGADIFYAKPADGKWQKINVKGDMPFKNITRLVINEQNNKLAVVVAE